MSLEAERGMLAGIRGLMPCLPSLLRGLCFDGKKPHERFPGPNRLAPMAFLKPSWLEELLGTHLNSTSQRVQPHSRLRDRRHGMVRMEPGGT